jgi:cysteine synthase
MSDVFNVPALIRLESNVVVARFEVLKMYSALAAVERLLEDGVIRKGDTLIDSSSGIYAYSLALACHRHGLRCHIVGSSAINETLRVQLEILGATIEKVRSTTDLKLDQGMRVERIQELLGENPKLYWMQQYHDHIHYEGYRRIAELFCQELDLRRLTMVAGTGTGASTGGFITYLREVEPEVRISGVEPFGSVTFGAERISDPGSLIAGIGASLPFRNVRHEFYDTVHWLSFDYCRSACIELLRRHAIFAGLSAGGSFLATEWERTVQPDRTYLFIAADTGHRYVEAVFRDHQDAVDLDGAAPTVIDDLDELTFPWSVMQWARRPRKAEQRDEPA